jgi:hypothetical protein
MPNRFFKIASAVFILGVSVVHSPSVAYAGEVKVDQFVVLRDSGGTGGLRKYVDDSFNDGTPPPSSESTYGNGSTPVSYIVSGVITEGGGKAVLNSDNGFPTLALAGTSIGEPILVNRARVRNSTDDLTNSGLKIIHQIEVRGLFDLVEPEKKGYAYGVSFSDRALNRGNVGNNNVRLSVGKSTVTGNNRISFHNSDFETGILDRAGTAPLDLNSPLTKSGLDACGVV